MNSDKWRRLRRDKFDRNLIGNDNDNDNDNDNNNDGEGEVMVKSCSSSASGGQKWRRPQETEMA